MVSHPQIAINCRTNGVQTITTSINTPICTPTTPSAAQEDATSYLFFIRKDLAEKGHSQASINVILASWRDGTNKQYQSYLKKWSTFCAERKCNILSPPLPVAVDFLTMLYESGLSYSSINTARSALSNLLQLQDQSISFGQLPVVKRFMKGLYELKPSFPRYQSIWDVSLVLNYLRKQLPVVDLCLMKLTLHLNFLLCLLSGQRCQTISYLSLDHMDLTDEKCVFVIMNKVKQSRVGHHTKPLEFLAYPQEKSLCILTHLREYITRTKTIRSSQQLLISYVKPHSAVSKDTISRWCRTILQAAGIDVSKFKGHSTRAASSSHLAGCNFNIREIISSAGWSSERTFQRFYNKPSESVFNFGKAILDSA